MTQAPYDPRAVANKLLDWAQEMMEGKATITPLALQKLLYFVHARYLEATGKPAVKGAFEAWPYGPVHPVIYKSFCEFKANPITSRAKGKNLIDGQEYNLAPPEDVELNRAIMTVLVNLAHLPAGKLVDLSHTPNGPWHFIWNQIQKGTVVTRQIPDSVTRERGRGMFVVTLTPANDSMNGEELPPKH